MQPTIDYVKASDGAANASLMTVTNVRAGGATTIQVNTVANAPVKFYGSYGEPHTFTDPVTGETITVISEATAVDFAGHIDGSNVEIDEIAPGYTDNGNEVGDIIIIRPNTSWANLVAEFLAPTGSVIPFAGASAPDYWLLCDGSAVSRTDYSRLFDLVGTTYGDGDGSSTFNVPDLRSRVAIGVGQGVFTLDFASTDVNVGTDEITVPTNTSLQTGAKLQLTTTGALPTGLSLATDYYVIRVSAAVIKLATTLANAIAGTAINITAQGSGTNTATVSYTNQTLGALGGEEAHALTTDELPSHRHGSGGGNTGTGIRSTAVAGGAHGNAGTVNNLTSSDTSYAGGSTLHNNLPPFLGLNHIIKT